jgi:putative transposase
MSRYQFIEQAAAIEPVLVLCRVLHVSAAGYYQWLGRADRPTPSWEPASPTRKSAASEEW